MGDYFWGFFFIILGVVFSIPYLVIKIVEWIYQDNPITVEELVIPKKKFVKLILIWCSQNLGHNEQSPDLKIYYYFNKKWGGLYNYRNRQITLYIPKWLTLNDLTKNVIHEYVHYLQIVKPVDDAMYNKHTQEVGYWDNPYEVAARRLAEKYHNTCLDWVLGKSVRN
ncbi:hypothetical protein BA6E_104163 [Bacteroidales bacterium 6E]|nr:hypothetical protein BA6E_104163 [Bacteroidales bacterium 6E]